MSRLRMIDSITALSGSTVYDRSRDVVCRQVGSESILVPIRQNVGNLDYVYTLSPVAARIWALLDGNRTIDAIVSQLCEEYEVTAEAAREDIGSLLADLDEVGLVERRQS